FKRTPTSETVSAWSADVCSSDRGRQELDHEEPARRDRRREPPGARPERKERAEARARRADATEDLPEETPHPGVVHERRAAGGREGGRGEPRRPGGQVAGCGAGGLQGPFQGPALLSAEGAGGARGDPGRAVGESEGHLTPAARRR